MKIIKELRKRMDDFIDRTKRKKFKTTKKGKLTIKEYKNYEDYVTHQKSKLQFTKQWLPEWDEQYRQNLKKRLPKTKGNVLCLGARLGGEVKAFKDLGHFATGIDLEPGQNNEHVLHGDFHNIQFPNKSADIIFTNSLDHSLRLGKLINEIRRILKPEGTLILEIADEENLGYYEAIQWENINDVIEMFQNKGFKVNKKERIQTPWQGTQVILQLKQ